MPCTMGPLGRSDFITDIEDRGPRILCGIFTVLERRGTLNAALSEVDWVEAGVPRIWAERWWKQHKKDDAARRKREKSEKVADDRRRALRDSARAKLTPEEIESLLDDRGDNDL